MCMWYSLRWGSQIFWNPVRVELSLWNPVIVELLSSPSMGTRVIPLPVFAQMYGKATSIGVS